VRQFDGKVDMDYAATGLRLRLSLRLPRKGAKLAPARTLAQTARKVTGPEAAPELP
jgi:hypothetical protein